MTTTTTVNGEQGFFVPQRAPLPGWSVQLTDPKGNKTTTTTLTDGSYTFTPQASGTYTVAEVNIPIDSDSTSRSTPNHEYTFYFDGTNSVPDLRFGNKYYSPFTVPVEGAIKIDDHGCGGCDLPLAGWVSELEDSEGNVLATTVSDGIGYYEIDVFPGTYQVAEEVQSSSVSTLPCRSFGLHRNRHLGRRDYRARLRQLREDHGIRCHVQRPRWQQVRDVGEPALNGWPVELLDSAGNVLAVATTDSNGNYVFNNLEKGTYQVTQVPQPNWVQTLPQFPTAYTFQAFSGGNLLALNFGNHSAPSLTPTQVIDNGQAGYSETGTWATGVAGFNGTNRIARTVHSGSSTATASWSFTGLPSAVYDVYVTFAGKRGDSIAAPFTVYDGTTSLGTQNLDESIRVTQAQGGRAQGGYGGVGWLELSSYAIASGTLQVQLGNLASNNFVDADGVLIDQEDAAPSVASSIATSAPNAASSSQIAFDPFNLVDSAAIKLGSEATGQAEARTINPDGASVPSPLVVMYHRGERPTVMQSSPTAIDAILGTVIDADRSRSSDLFTTLAQTLLTGKKPKSRKF